jgi:hypothetical protein
MANENRHIRNVIAATDREIERRRKIAKTSAEEQERERRRFPPPWHVYLSTECFVVKDSDGRLLACVYFEDEAAGRTAPALPSYDEAHRIAGHIARLPELLQQVIIRPVRRPTHVTCGVKPVRPKGPPKARTAASPFKTHMPDRSEVIFRYVAFGIGAGVIAAAILYVSWFYR